MGTSTLTGCVGTRWAAGGGHQHAASWSEVGTVCAHRMSFLGEVAQPTAHIHATTRGARRESVGQVQGAGSGPFRAEPQQQTHWKGRSGVLKSWPPSRSAQLLLRTSPTLVILRSEIALAMMSSMRRKFIRKARHRQQSPRGRRRLRRTGWWHRRYRALTIAIAENTLEPGSRSARALTG